MVGSPLAGSSRERVPGLFGVHPSPLAAPQGPGSPLRGGGLSVPAPRRERSDSRRPVPGHKQPRTSLPPPGPPPLGRPPRTRQRLRGPRAGLPPLNGRLSLISSSLAPRGRGSLRRPRKQRRGQRPLPSSRPLSPPPAKESAAARPRRLTAAGDLRARRRGSRPRPAVLPRPVSAPSWSRPRAGRPAPPAHPSRSLPRARTRRPAFTRAQ